MRNTDIFIDIIPVQTNTTAANNEIIPLFLIGFQQAGKICQGHGQLSSIGKQYPHVIVIKPYLLGTRFIY